MNYANVIKSKGHWGVAALLAVAAGLVAGQVVTPEQVGMNDTTIELIAGAVVGGLTVLAKKLVTKLTAPKEEPK